MTFGKNYPVDGAAGAVLRTLSLYSLALLFGTYAAHIAATEGISTRFGGYRAWVFFTPAFTAAVAALFALRATYWLAAGFSASDRQLMVWRRNLFMELLFTGLGGFCVLVGNVPGMAWDLGPLGMISVIVGLGFLGNPQGVLLDGERRRIVESGLLYAGVRSLDGASLVPLRIISQPSGFESWHLGLGVLALSPAISREEAHRVAEYARARTGLAAGGEDAQLMQRALEVLGDGLAQAKALEGVRPPATDPVARFLALESVLRATHGEGALFVKPMAYASAGRTIAVAGWAFLDGQPAIVPTNLDLLTITSTSATGALDTLGREPSAVLALLGARVERHDQPCPHFTVRVSESDKPALLAQIAALPDHRPGAPASSPAPRPQSAAQTSAATPEGYVHARQHRLLLPSVTFQAVNDALYTAGFKSVLPISEVEPEAAIWERAMTPKSYVTPRVTYAMDAKLGAKRLVIEWLAARDVPSLPTIDAESIDLSPTLPVDVLGRNLAQLTWLTASTPGWSGLAGAVETVRPHPSPLAPMKWESPRQGPEMVCYSDPSPISLERVAALKSAEDRGVASAALNLEKQWLAQRAMNRR